MSSASRADRLLAAAREAKGFMPDDEGLALAAVAERAGAGFSSVIEIGAYCGRSTLYLATGIARAAGWGASGTVIFSVDHHHGSEENQAGWEHHDETLVDPATGRMDTLPFWRSALEGAGAEDLAIAVAVAQLHRNEILVRRRRDVAHRQRPLFNRPPQRLPEIVECNSMLQQLTGLVRQELAYA